MSLVSENIRYLRKLNGLTQEQFARRLGIKRSLVGAYEEARANPNPNNMIAIAKSFNVSVENLQRQDLRKLRETPNLSFDRGSRDSGSGNGIPSRSIFREPQPNTDDDRLFSDEPLLGTNTVPDRTRPDLTDVPKPLASVLEKYYRAPTAVPPPAGPQPADTSDRDRMPDRAPVPFEIPQIGDPVRPGQASNPAPSADRVPFEVRPATPPPAPENRAHVAPPQPARQPAPEPLTFNNAFEQAPAPTGSNPRDDSSLPSIPLVMQYQFGEYGQRHTQHEYINRLPSLRLPTLPVGHYRAFEADADFPMPGALLVGQFVRNWFDIADGKLYVLMTPQGLICRRVFNQVKIKGTLLLTADRPTVPSREMPLKEVREMWEVKAFFSQQLPEPAPNLDRMRQLVEEMRFEVERIN
ncbi:MAG: helix-turn-helix domain-containing protein [Cytophagales bacterium]|nr:MAG: helix-turn-helix domain-containing protein [Cytophagales bacterium]